MSGRLERVRPYHSGRCEMRQGRRTCFLSVLGILLSAASMGASQAPVTVSPGTATGARIADSCPTFSWGGIPEARSYELVGPALIQGPKGGL